MGAWTELTLAVVQNALPTDMATLYATWVDANAGKANRLSELVAEIRTTYREAVAANPANELDPDTDKVPAMGFRHALNSVIFNLGMEMGVQFAPEVYSLITRADIWLRMVQNGQIRVDSIAGQGTPSYSVPERARWLCG